MTASTPPALDGVVVRPVETRLEYEACVALQDDTWGAGFRDRVPASILLVAQKVGGVTAGAFAPDGRLLGFVFGITGVREGRIVHWSDMLAVRPEARGRRLGERLKHFQRDRARAAGAVIMYWTFDPLVARNAHLNLERLGARVAEYVPDMYGSDTGSPLHGAIPTDRFVAAWDLAAAEPAEHPRAGPGADRLGDLPIVNAPADDGGPVAGGEGGLPDAPRVRLAVPRDVHALDPPRMARWRLATRQAVLAYLGRGYEIVGFARGDGAEPPCYLLRRAP